MENLFELNYIQTDSQKADILTKSLGSQKHRKMVNLIGLKPIITVLCLMAIMQANANFQHEDPAIWRQTNVIHIDGQIDANIIFSFVDPCDALFSNLTGIITVDRGLKQTCSRRFEKDILESLRSLSDIGNRSKRDDTPHVTASIKPTQSTTHQISTTTLIRQKRDGGITAIIALSALYVASYSAYSSHESEEKTKKQMALLLGERVSILQDKFILVSNRISTRLNAIEKDVHFLGELSAAQPAINDAMDQATMQMHGVKLKILALNDSLKIGEPIPISFLELFNMTNLAPKAALKHSRLQTLDIRNDQIQLNLLVPTLSKHVTILKAEAFNYRAIVDGKVCDHFYIGPPYVLYNASSRCIRPLISNEIVDETVIGRGCRISHALTNVSMFEPLNCSTIITILSDPPFNSSMMVDVFA